MNFTTTNGELSGCLRCEKFVTRGDRTVPAIRCPDCGREIIDVSGSLSRISIPSAVLHRIPEAVARQNGVMPFEYQDIGFVVVLDLIDGDVEIFEQLRFVLNCDIAGLHAETDAIQRAIDRDYGENGQ